MNARRDFAQYAVPSLVSAVVRRQHTSVSQGRRELVYKYGASTGREISRKSHTHQYVLQVILRHRLPGRRRRRLC